MSFVDLCFSRKLCHSMNNVSPEKLLLLLVWRWQVKSCTCPKYYYTCLWYQQCNGEAVGVVTFSQLICQKRNGYTENLKWNKKLFYHLNIFKNIYQYIEMQLSGQSTYKGGISFKNKFTLNWRLWHFRTNKPLVFLKPSPKSQKLELFIQIERVLRTVCNVYLLP